MKQGNKIINELEKPGLWCDGQRRGSFKKKCNGKGEGEYELFL